MSPFIPVKSALAEYLGDTSILVIEPSLNYRTSIKQFLTNLKIRRMKLVSTVAEARREMLATRAGLFIVEWSLDGMNGLQFCRQLRKEPAYKDVPFLLLSVENLRTDVILATEVSIDGYLLKPFSYEEFAAQLAQIIKAKKDPGTATSLLDRAEADLVAGRLADAEVNFVAALSVKERSARALTGLGRLKLKRGDPEGALESLRQAVASNPDYIEAYRAMLDVHESKGDRSSVIQVASMLHALSPDNPRYTLLLAKSYLEMQHLVGAEQYFKQTITLSPRIAEAYKGLGIVHTARDEHEKAVKSFRKALDLDETDVSTLNSLGMAYIRMGQFKAGVDKYLLAIKLNPSDHRVHFNLGHAYEKRGDLARAKSYYSQALTHCPDFEKAERGLKRLAESGQLQVAAGDSLLSGLVAAAKDEDDESF